MIDISTLIEWLGPEGARSGLRDSDLSLKDLIELVRACQLPLSPKPTRDEVANELAYQNRQKLDKPLDELMRMPRGDLLDYVEKKKPTISEALGILSQLGIKPGSEDRKHLLRFVAREISETGMFQRVAHGTVDAATRKS
jgi:hypothetical protein